MSAPLDEVVGDLFDTVKSLRTSQPIRAGRRARTAATVTSWAAATGYAAPPDGLGPDRVLFVGPSGRLQVTVSARLTITAGTTPRLLMGWQVTGPYLDEAMTATPNGVAASTVLPVDARALALGMIGEVSASRTSEAAGLSSGWYLLQARYALTGTGSLAAAADLREIIGEPL